MRCPRCRIDLGGVRTTHGVAYVCEGCGGQAATMAVLRRSLTVEAANTLWRGARGAERGGELPCPSCAKSMVEVAFSRVQGRATVDGCETCALVWFDVGELEGAPTRPPPPSPERLSPRAAEALVRVRMARAEDEGAFDEQIADDNALAAQAMGTPVLSGVPYRSTRPWLTYLLALGLVAATVATLAGVWASAIPGDARMRERAVAETYGFQPAAALRHGGATLLTSFFVQVGRGSPLLAVLVLLLFGRAVEDRLGRLRFLGLLAAGHLLGLLAHALTTAEPGLLLCGAGAGLAALFGWSVLALPRAKVSTGAGVLWWDRTRGYPVGYLPISLAFGLWLAFELLLVAVVGWSSGGTWRIVFSPAAHLGGALVGLAAGLYTRRREQRDLASERAQTATPGMRSPPR